jgi:hypothetical protein
MSVATAVLYETFENDLEKAGSVITETWVSSAGGAYTQAITLRGFLVGIQYIPNGGGTQPTNLYDHSLVDANGVDVLLTPSGSKASLGTDLSNTTPNYYPEANSGKPVIAYLNGAYTSTIANGGSAKGGTIIYYMKNR